MPIANAPNVIECVATQSAKNSFLRISKKAVKLSLTIKFIKNYL